MGLYCNPGDCTDPAVTVAVSHCEDAATRIDALLWERGIDPSTVAGGNAQLQLLAVALATAAACLERSRGEDTTLLAKSEMYQRRGDALARTLSRAVLGVSASDSGQGGGVGSVPIGRA